MCCCELTQLSSVVFGLFVRWRNGYLQSIMGRVGLFCLSLKGQIRRVDLESLYHLLLKFSQQVWLIFFLFFKGNFFLKLAAIWVKYFKFCYSCAICCWACLCRLHVVSDYIKSHTVRVTDFRLRTLDISPGCGFTMQNQWLDQGTTNTQRMWFVKKTQDFLRV